MVFNSKTYHANKTRRKAYKTLDMARREKASPYCDPARVRRLVRIARNGMRLGMMMRGDNVPYYRIHPETNP